MEQENKQDEPSKEVLAIADALYNYVKKHQELGNDPVVNCSVSACDIKDPAFPIIDDRLIQYGAKETLIVDAECVLEETQKEDK